MNLKSLKLFLFFCLTIALCSGDNIIELGVSNVKKLGNNEYLIDIYAKNNVPIAGIQFDILGEPFTEVTKTKIDQAIAQNDEDNAIYIVIKVIL